MKFVVYILSFFSCNILISQDLNTDISNSISDCNGAIELNSNRMSTIEVPNRDGNIIDDEFSANPGFHEDNSVWLKYSTLVSGELSLDIIPFDTSANIDFYVFKAERDEICDLIQKDEIVPIRFNENKNHNSTGLTSVKGLNDETYENSLLISRNDIIMILINIPNPSKKMDMRVKLNFELQADSKAIENEVYVQDFTSDYENKKLRVRIRDKESGLPVEANMKINGAQEDLMFGTDFLFDIERSSDVIFEVSARGYFFNTKREMLERDTDMELSVELEPLAIGKKLNLDEIKFVAGTDEILPSSFPLLKRLLDFMATNSSVLIDIHGHVNSPGTTNNVQLQKLSESRAKAVLFYLSRAGIDRKRMGWKGFGNVEMIYDNPATYEEEQMNRRVEIIIVGY